MGNPNGNANGMSASAGANGHASLNPGRQFHGDGREDVDVDEDAAMQPLLDKRSHGGHTAAAQLRGGRSTAEQPRPVKGGNGLRFSSSPPSSSSFSLTSLRVLALLLFSSLCILSLAWLWLQSSDWASALLPFASPASSSPLACASSVPASPSFHALFPVIAGRTLVVAVHASHDPAYAENLRYFVQKFDSTRKHTRRHCTARTALNACPAPRMR